MKPAGLIDKQIAAFPDWRGQMLKKIRRLVHEADPEAKEDWKWGTAVWTHNGLLCAMSAFKAHVKINFFKGSQLLDPQHVFNNGLDSKVLRAIDFFEGDTINESEIKNLIRAAVDLNLASK